MLIVVICVVIPIISNSVISEEIQQGSYCTIFNPTCGNDEVILMLDALYGRMGYGECIKKNNETILYETFPKMFGCSRNILDFMHEKCSLTKYCNISIASVQGHLTEFPVCDAYSYLESKYQCVKPNVDSCNINVSRNPILISSVKATDCGYKFQITTPGYTIHISPLFALRRSDQISTNNLKLGSIFDSRGTMVGSINMTGNGTGITSIIESLSSITIDMNQDLEKWMLNITAHGCQDPKLKTFTSILNRKGSNITIKCDLNDEQWTLQCGANGQWIGDDNINCKKTVLMESTGIILVSCIALTTVSLVTIICCIFFKIKRQRIANAREQNRKRNKITEFVYKDGDQYKDVVDNRFSTTAHQHLEPPEINYTAGILQSLDSKLYNSRMPDKNMQFYTMTSANPIKKENLPYSAGCTCLTMKYPQHYHHHPYANTGNFQDMTSDLPIARESPYGHLSQQPAYPIFYPTLHQNYSFNPYIGTMTRVAVPYANDEIGPIYNTLEVIPSPEIVMTSHQIIDPSDQPTDLTMARAKLKLSREDIMAAENAAWEEMK